MKISKYIKSLIWVAPFLGLLSCSEELEDFKIQGNNGEGVLIELTVPEDIVTVLSRADENKDVSDIEINSLSVIQYNNSASCIKAETLDDTNISLDSNGKYSFQYIFESNTTKAEFIVNIESYDLQRIRSNQATALSISTTEKVLWGSANIGAVGSQVSVSLTRNYAKLNMENDAEDFEIVSYNIYGTATSGTIAPNGDKLTTPSGVYYGDKTEALSGIAFDKTILPIFETPASETPFIIIEGKYKNTTYYYKVAFAERIYKDNSNKGASPSNDSYPDEIVGNYTYNYKDILRNHRYIVKIDYVRAEGWSNIKDALKAEPDNRITANITDVNTDIRDIIACRDYALGVSGSQLSAKGSESSFTFSIVHNYKNSTNSYPKPSVSISTNTWIKSYTVGNGVSCTDIFKGDVDSDGSYTSQTNTGYKYNVNLTFDLNADDQNSRSVEILVKVGDLSRTITFTQEARDYLRDNTNRNVILWVPSTSGSYPTSPTTPDYFAWIDQSNRDLGGPFCYGVRPQDNRGAIRTNGLIFPPVNVYGGTSIRYYIQGKETDEFVEKPDGFTVSEDLTTYGSKNYWVLTQSNPTSESGLSVDKKLVIKDGDVEITYIIYNVGFFHELTASMASIQGGSGAKSGWYYYEFVKKNNLYVLDRNIGAENNQPYISTYLGYYNNSGAIGGYFQVADARASKTNDDISAKFWLYRNQSDKTIITTLGLGTTNNSSSQFHIPTWGDMRSLNVSLSRPTTGVSGNASYVAAIRNVEGFIKDERIYIPHGGYYEGEVQKLPTRANIWTGTLYSESQGYHPNYASDKFPNTNYGFWYYYLDAQPVSGKTNIYNQIRCTDATKDDFSDASFYRYMPVRLVWGTANNDPVEDNSDDDDDDGNNNEDYFMNGNTITVNWTNNWWMGSTHSWYHYIYVYYTPKGGTKQEPLGGYYNSPAGGDINSEHGNTYTFNVNYDNVETIHIIVHNGQGNDEMKFDITTSSIKYISGSGAPSGNANISNNGTNYKVKLF